MKLYLSSFRVGNKPEELLRLLDGKRKTALIVNAMDFLDPQQRRENLAEEVARLEPLGLEITEVDLRHYFGKPKELEAELKKYDLIWMRGGNCFILRRALRQSGADKILKDLIKRDAIVYGGYSAGIDMLVSSFKGIELVDDPNIVPDGYDSDIIWEGLGILPYSIAPHYKSDHPESADVDKSVEYMINNHIPFVALKDGQAIVIDGEERKVVG